MSSALLMVGALVFLLGMLTGACVLRVRVTKFGSRMLIDIGRPRRGGTRPDEYRPDNRLQGGGYQPRESAGSRRPPTGGGRAR